MSRPFRVCLVAALSAVCNAAIAQRPPAFTPVSLLPANTAVDEVSVTGDGNRVYYSTPKGEVMLFDRRASKTSRVSEGGDIWDVTVAANGSALAFTKSGETNKDEFVWTVPLDPATGLAAGAQRRASMMPGDTPALSHDGRMLAFARDDSVAGQSLVVLPTLGGPERVLATFPVPIGEISWTPDGKALSFFLNPPRSNRAAAGTAEWISVAGGSPRVVGMTGGSGHPGLSPDGSVIAYFDTGFTREVVVADTNGRRLARITPPPGFLANAWMGGTTLLATRSTSPWRQHMYDLATGASRLVADTIDRTGWPAWSTDGTRFSFVKYFVGRSELVVMNRDGSSSRVIPLKQNYGHGSVWSPDGKWSLHLTAGLPTTAVAVELGTARQVALLTSDHEVHAKWSGDSRYALIADNAYRNQAPTLSLREADLSGTSRTLLEIPRQPGYQLFPLDRNSAFVRRGPSSPMILEPLSGRGRGVQLLPSVPGFFSGPSLSPDGKLVVFRRSTQLEGDVKFSVLDIVKMDGTDYTSITMPFIIAPIGVGFLPGDKQLVVTENPQTSQQRPGVYLVTIATHEVKKLFSMRLGGNRSAEVSLSPDGKTILYTSRDSLPPAYATLDVSRLLRSQP